MSISVVKFWPTDQLLDLIYLHSIEDVVVKVGKLLGGLIQLEFSSKFLLSKPGLGRLSAAERHFDHVTALGLAAKATGTQIGNQDKVFQQSATGTGVDIAFEKDRVAIDVHRRFRRPVWCTFRLLQLVEMDTRVPFWDLG